MKKFEEELEQLKNNSHTNFYGYMGIRLFTEPEIIETFKDWVSPEDHQKVVEDLTNARSSITNLMAQLDYYKKDKRFEAMAEEILSLKTQLEKQQPEIPEVPQFVADWYEENKSHLEYRIWKYIRCWNDHEKDDFYDFMNGAHSNPIETLINMKNGYTVAKPKTIVSPCPVCGFEDVENNFCGMCGHKNEYVTADEVEE